MRYNTLEEELRTLILRKGKHKQKQYKKIKKEFSKLGIGVTKQFLKHIALAENEYYRLTEITKKIERELEKRQNKRGFSEYNEIMIEHITKQKEQIQEQIKAILKTKERIQYNSIIRTISTLTKESRGLPFLSWKPLTPKQQMRKDYAIHKDDRDYIDFLDYIQKRHDKRQEIRNMNSILV